MDLTGLIVKLWAEGVIAWLLMVMLLVAGVYAGVWWTLGWLSETDRREWEQQEETRRRLDAVVRFPGKDKSA